MEMLTQNQVCKKSEITGMVLGKNYASAKFVSLPFPFPMCVSLTQSFSHFPSVKRKIHPLLKAKTPLRVMRVGWWRWGW